MKKDNCLIGKRIGECLKHQKMTQAELLRVLERKKQPMSKQNLSGIINRGTPLADEKIRTIAEILNVYPEYLFGEKPLCESYDEFKEVMNLDNDPNFSKYKKVLDPAKLFLSSSVNSGGILEYTVTDSDTRIRKDFSSDDIALFYSKIIEAIRDLFNDYEDDIPIDFHDPEKWIRYFSWHPNEFNDDIKKNILSESTAMKEGDALD